MEAEEVFGGERRLAHHLAHLCICICAFLLVGWQCLVCGGGVDDAYMRVFCVVVGRDEGWWSRVESCTYTCVCVYTHRHEEGRDAEGRHVREDELPPAS